jgi:hypothetical protein
MTTLQICDRFTFSSARSLKRGGANQLHAGWKSACVIFLLCAATAMVAPAQTFTILQSFPQGTSANPLIQGADGSLYGTTGYPPYPLGARSL